MLEKSIETALSKMSKAHDLVSRLEQYIDRSNAKCRAQETPGSGWKLYTHAHIHTHIRITCMHVYIYTYIYIYSYMHAYPIYMCAYLFVHRFVMNFLDPSQRKMHGSLCTCMGSERGGSILV